MTNIIPAINVSEGARAKNTPSDVATPFPPLKFKKMLQLCPHITESEERMAIVSPRPSVNETKGKIKPFKMSKIRTKIPHLFPNTLQTLVNPIFPDPSFLMSYPFILPKIYPNGIEPKRYANKIIVTSFI